MAKERIDSREKGKRAERECAAIWTDLGFPARRGQQFSGIEGKDIGGPAGFHIECKHCERMQLYKWMEQATDDANGDEVPVVCHRKNREEFLITMRLKDFPASCVNGFLGLADD